MMREQVIPALFAALVEEGVDPGLVERAVGRVLDIPLGASVTGDSPLLRAFAFEQQRRLEGGHDDEDELGLVARAETQRLTPLRTDLAREETRRLNEPLRGAGWQKPVAPPDASARPAGMPPGRR